MKIKTLVGICKRQKHIKLYYNSEKNLQYMGDGGAIYPLTNMPILDEDNIFTVFDIDENKISFNNSELPKRIDFEDSSNCENEVIIEKISICKDDVTLIPIRTSQGLIFIKAEYLEPLTNSEYFALFERVSADGQIYIVAKNGLILIAVINPYKVVDEEFIKLLTELTQQAKLTFENSEIYNEN